MNNTTKWIIGLIIVVAIIWFGFMNKTDDTDDILFDEEVATEEVMDVADVNTTEEVVDTVTETGASEEVAQ